MRPAATILLFLLLNAVSAGAHDNGPGPETYLARSRQAQDDHRFPDAKAYAQKAIVGFTAGNQPDSLGEAYVMLWSASTLDGLSYTERTPILQKAAAAFEMAGNRRRQGDCLKEMGDIYQIEGNYAVSLFVLKNALTLYQSARFPYLQGVYDMLCVVEAHLGDYKESIHYGLLCISTLTAMGDTSASLCAYYNHVGEAYYDLRDTAQAHLYFTKAYDVATRYVDEDGIVTLAYNLTNLYTATGKPQQALSFFSEARAKYPAMFTRNALTACSAMISIYDGLRQFNRSESICDTLARGLQKATRDIDMCAGYYASLVRHYFKTAKYDKAAEYLTAYEQFLDPVKVARYQTQILLWRFHIDSATGRYVDAIRTYQQYKMLADSVSNENVRRQIQQYNVLYETEKKDKSIQVLQQQSELQLTNLSHERFLRKVTIGGIGLLLFILGLLYFAFRGKLRSNRRLREQGELIDRKNQSLQRLVTEKEWLVKEIHHRVKNNLHMVVGLLASQAEFIKGKEAFEAITDSQHRVQAMSLIHQKLYQTENLSSIDMPVYVFELVDYLEDSFDSNTPIQFNLEIDKVAFPLSHSIPIGLILNEAITNAIKYAFPCGRKGTIAISLTQTGKTRYVLTIRDDGIGIPEDLQHHSSSSSLGLTLIRGLADDIMGRLTIGNDNGTVVTLVFSVPEEKTVTT